MCNIAHVKTTKSSTYFIENNNYLLKSYILDTKGTSSNVKLLF